MIFLLIQSFNALKVGCPVGRLFPRMSEWEVNSVKLLPSFVDENKRSHATKVQDSPDTHIRGVKKSGY